MKTNTNQQVPGLMPRKRPEATLKEMEQFKKLVNEQWAKRHEMPKR